MNSTLSTRRQFLTAGAALPFAWRAMAETLAVAPRWIFLGTDRGKGIYRALFNYQTGELGKIELVAETDRPDYFAVHKDQDEHPILYTVNSVGDGKGGVSCYGVDPATGKLAFLNRVTSHGDGPCFISVDEWGDSAFVANYTGGSFAAYRLADNGMLRDLGGVLDCRGNTVCGSLGPVKDRQDAAHLHCATISPDNDFVLVCNLGEDAIEVIPIDPDEAQVLGTPMRVSARAGSGPRHLAFDAFGKWLYCINELDCTIDIYDWNVKRNRATMTLREGSTISTLAKGIGLTGNTGCEIMMSYNEQFVYACTRGVDEITVYRVDRTTGLLTEQQRVSSGGKIPRYITLDPSGKWLVCCNQGAAVANPVGNVTVFAHDAAIGRLSEKPKVFSAETPMFAAFV
jgi:6-phosphogluconolactonase